MLLFSSLFPYFFVHYYKNILLEKKLQKIQFDVFESDEKKNAKKIGDIALKIKVQNFFHRMQNLLTD